MRAVLGDALAPVEHRVWVPIAQDLAFALFTQGLARWWPMASHSCSGDRAAGVTLEPWVGGRVTERTPAGADHLWGTLTTWDPPHRLAMHWHPGQPADQATRLTVRFVARDGGCEVHVRHDGWTARGPDAARVRDGYDRGWPAVLRRFSDRAGSTEEHRT